VAVGGPSILSIIESVLVDHQLVPALQWIVDGYNRIMAVLGAAVEPLVQPAIEWVNARFGWGLVLDPVWRPVFALGMVVVVASARTAIRGGELRNALLAGPFSTAAVFIAALVVGLFAAGTGWASQGAVAGAPLLLMGATGAAIVFARGQFNEARIGLLLFSQFSALFFVLGAGLSFVPGLASCSGVLALGGAIALWGALVVAAGLSTRERLFTRIGLTILGGFVAAGLILAADWSLKALSAG
jgi:hypothetical protein